MRIKGYNKNKEQLLNLFGKWKEEVTITYFENKTKKTIAAFTVYRSVVACAINYNEF